jgi:hypothetical protein
MKEYSKSLELQAMTLKDQHDTQIEARQNLSRDLTQRPETMEISNAASSGLTACHDVMQATQESLRTPKAGTNTIANRIVTIPPHRPPGRIPL